MSVWCMDIQLCVSSNSFLSRCRFIMPLQMLIFPKRRYIFVFGCTLDDQPTCKFSFSSKQFAHSEPNYRFLPPAMGSTTMFSLARYLRTMASGRAKWICNRWVGGIGVAGNGMVSHHWVAGCQVELKFAPLRWSVYASEELGSDPYLTLWWQVCVLCGHRTSLHIADFKNGLKVR